jgi:hypothetical protein
MTHRIVVNVQTGETTQVNLTAEEIAQAQAATIAWNAEQAEIQAQPTTQDLITQQQALITALTTRITALENNNATQ